jgi:hypothetical protein
MEIIQQRDIIREVHHRWTEQYKQYPADQKIGIREKAEPVGVIRKRLAALNLDVCSVADVDKALDTTGWADNECDECHKSFPVLVRLGGTPDYDSRWQDLCAGCLAKAAELAASTNPLP